MAESPKKQQKRISQVRKTQIRSQPRKSSKKQFVSPNLGYSLFGSFIVAIPLFALWFINRSQIEELKIKGSQGTTPELLQRLSDDVAQLRIDVNRTDATRSQQIDKVAEDVQKNTLKLSRIPTLPALRSEGMLIDNKLTEIKSQSERVDKISKELQSLLSEIQKTAATPPWWSPVLGVGVGVLVASVAGIIGSAAKIGIVPNLIIAGGSGLVSGLAATAMRP